MCCNTPMGRTHIQEKISVGVDPTEFGSTNWTSKCKQTVPVNDRDFDVHFDGGGRYKEPIGLHSNNLSPRPVTLL
jgi:hypothetical protein